jgi:hypothetical protein
MGTLFDIVVFAAGFGVCWLCKDTVVHLVTGTNALIASLEAKLAMLKAKP